MGFAFVSLRAHPFASIACFNDQVGFVSNYLVVGNAVPDGGGEALVNILGVFAGSTCCYLKTAHQVASAEASLHMNLIVWLLLLSLTAVQRSPDGPSLAGGC